MNAPRLSPRASDASLHDELVQRIDSGGLELPLLNETAANVMTLCADPTCDARRLAELIQRDQALAGHVLRVANSVAYAPSEPIVSLQQAVSRMGLMVMRDIALAVAIKGKVFSAPGHEADIRELWLHSASAGAWAKEIARLRRRNVEGAFLTGLMHDVGKPVVLQAAVDIFLEAEREVDAATLHAWLDQHHTQVGAQLLGYWSMPDWMQSATLWHHEPERAPDDAVEVASTVCLADLLSHWSLADGKASEDILRHHPVLARLSLYSDDLDELLARREHVSLVSKALL